MALVVVGIANFVVLHRIDPGEDQLFVARQIRLGLTVALSAWLWSGSIAARFLVIAVCSGAVLLGTTRVNEVFSVSSALGAWFVTMLAVYGSSAVALLVSFPNAPESEAANNEPAMRPIPCPQCGAVNLPDEYGRCPACLGRLL